VFVCSYFAQLCVLAQKNSVALAAYYFTIDHEAEGLYVTKVGNIYIV